MARKIKCPIVPFASVGEAVTASDGHKYIIEWVDGARVRLKHLGPDGKVGRGRPSNGLMSGDPARTVVDNIGEVSMAGPITREENIKVPIYVVPPRD